MKTNANTSAQKFNSCVKDLITLEKKANKSIVDTFKAGDVIACFDGYPSAVLCIVELTKDNPDVDNFSDFITGNSYSPLTSHLISANWFKIN
jgi:hypothetical protein